MRVTAAVLSAALLSTPLSAAAIGAPQDFHLSATFTDFTQWNLFGSASASTGIAGGKLTSILTLTTAQTGGQSGAAFAPTPIALDFNSPFTFTFDFVIAGDALRGDGFTFVLSAETGLYGFDGSGLGYDGLPGPSVAFAVDTFNFEDEPESPSLQILLNGSVSPATSTETALGDDIRDPASHWTASVAYLPSGNDDNTGTLTGSIQDATFGFRQVAFDIDFGSLGLAGADIYYGFTAANGAATDGHSILSAAPVPEPATWVMLVAGLATLGLAMSRHRMARF